ncbi:GntR family transcriptional regulator [Streptomyces microflavus]|nr:GntR family transcriptional regulator [Streptomyces microflavus]
MIRGQVAQFLILAHTWPTTLGGAIPNEQASARYWVSTATLHNALALLQAEGLIVTRSAVSTIGWPSS